MKHIAWLPDSLVIVLFYRAVQCVWEQLSLLAHHRQGRWVPWCINCSILFWCHQQKMMLFYKMIICTNSQFQMKPQERVFFKDPIKLIQSRLEHFSQVCLVKCYHRAVSLLLLESCHSGMLNVRAFSQLTRDFSNYGYIKSMALRPWYFEKISWLLVVF